MAIQKNKIPTPTEIKSSPTSFTEEELKKLNNLSDSINELNSQFGVFYINKIKLERKYRFKIRNIYPLKIIFLKISLYL